MLYDFYFCETRSNKDIELYVGRNFSPFIPFNRLDGYLVSRYSPTHRLHSDVLMQMISAQLTCSFRRKVESVNFNSRLRISLTRYVASRGDFRPNKSVHVVSEAIINECLFMTTRSK